MRLPIVMTVANRALSGPLSIWNDHGDIMAARDIGWIQIFVENGQEAFDHCVMAFKIAENHQVLLPTIINLDGFILTHVVEALEMVDQETVDGFLPPLIPYHQAGHQEARDHGGLCHAGTLHRSARWPTRWP